MRYRYPRLGFHETCEDYGDSEASLRVSRVSDSHTDRSTEDVAVRRPAYRLGEIGAASFFEWPGLRSGMLHIETFRLPSFSMHDRRLQD